MNFNGDIEDFGAIMVCAVRYALGRRTYVVSWIAEIVSNNLEQLSEKDINVMIRDIEECDYYGDECDKAVWFELLDKLKSGKKR